MEANPSAALLHVLLEGLALLPTARHGIQADDDAVLLQLLQGIVGQRRGDVHQPAFAIRELVEELDSLLVKLDMSFLGMWFIMQERTEARPAGIVGGISTAHLRHKARGGEAEDGEKKLL